MPDLMNWKYISLSQDKVVKKSVSYGPGNTVNGKVVNTTYQLLYPWESDPVSIVQEV
jgi:hypothetical protein